MAKKGELLGKIGDSTYYRTPDGKVVDDSGEEVKGPIAKTLAADYEAKQQERAAQQAEAKKAADEAKASRAAQAAAEKQARQQRLASERQAAAEARRQEAQAGREASRQANQQLAQRANVQPTPSAPIQEAPKAGPTVGQRVGGAFKQAAMSVGQTAFTGAFPTLSGIINRNVPDRENEPVSAGGGGGGGSRQSLNRIADEINTTNQMLQTNTARAEMTNQILGLILKEVQQLKKPSLLESLIGGAGSLLGMGEAVAGAGAGAAVGGAAKTGIKSLPKTGVLGGARGLLTRAPLIGALLGGGFSAYDEYQESGNATRAASTGAGSAVGGGLGAWGGAGAGAALGAFGGPVGIAIGGLLGAAIGGYGGSWLGGKAGKAGYDALATPDASKTGAIPQASKDIKAAQDAAKVNNQILESPKDSIVNVKTLTFNADSIIFNAKNQQTVATTNAPAAAGPTSTVKPAVSSGAPLPSAQNISGPTQSGSVREALASAQTPSFFGFGMSQVQDARANAGTTSFGVTPGALAPAKIQPNQGAVQTASLGPAGTGGLSDASAVQLASTMVGKSRTQSLDYLKAGGYNNKGEAWCAEFVNSSLKQTGGTGSGSAVANSFQKWGTQVDPIKVQAGDVVLQTRGHGPGETGGHVGIATGKYQHGQIEMIAGNSSGQVKRYFVPVNGQLQVRRGSGGSGNNPKLAEATRDPSAGNAAGAARASNPSSTNATPSPGATGGAINAGAGRGSVVEGLNDRANAQMGAGAGRGDGSLEMAARAADVGVGAGRGDGNAEMAARAADAGNKDASPQEAPAAVAANLSPKESGVMAGIGGIPPQLKGIMGGVLQGFLGNSRGSQLVQASMREMMSDRSARTGITVNQHTSQTPTTNTTGGKFNHHDVGHVEPVDARTRLKELFGILAG